MNEKVEDIIKDHVNQHGNWILGLHYDKETKAFRRYDLNNIKNGKLELKYTDKLYDPKDTIAYTIK